MPISSLSPADMGMNSPFISSIDISKKSLMALRPGVYALSAMCVFPFLVYCGRPQSLIDWPGVCAALANSADNRPQIVTGIAIGATAQPIAWSSIHAHPNSIAITARIHTTAPASIDRR